MITQHQQTYAKNRQTKKAYAFCVKVNIIDRLFCVQAVWKVFCYELFPQDCFIFSRPLHIYRLRLLYFPIRFGHEPVRIVHPATLVRIGCRAVGHCYGIQFSIFQICPLALGIVDCRSGRLRSRCRRLSNLAAKPAARHRPFLRRTLDLPPARLALVRLVWTHRSRLWQLRRAGLSIRRRPAGVEYFVFQLRGIAAALGLVENQKNLIGFDIKRPSEISDGLRPLQKSLSSNSRNLNKDFRLFLFQISNNSIQILP